MLQGRDRKELSDSKASAPYHRFLENVITSAFCRTSTYGVAKERAVEVLHFCEMEKKLDFSAKSLTIGDRKRLEIARALATEPKLLLLDETMAGLTPQEQAERGVRLIHKIRNSGIAIIIVEHIMQVIMNLCDRILCIITARNSQGTPPEVANNQAVVEAYLGRD